MDLSHNNTTFFVLPCFSLVTSDIPHLKPICPLQTKSFIRNEQIYLIFIHSDTIS